MKFEFSFDDDALRGRTILVAGGTGGLGSASAALLARDGATVVCGYRSDSLRAEALRDFVLERYGKTIHLVQGDIAEEEGRRRCLEAVDRLGILYGVVCCTGDPGRVKFDQVEERDLNESMRLNYYGPILLAREAAQRMQAVKTSGSLVFFSTMQSVGVFESSINYAGPKTALQQAALVMAKQWGGPDGIRVNVVAPGVNRAGMALQSIESGKYDFFVDQGIIPRFGRPEDTARVVRLLMQPDNYVTGQIIAVDGGLVLRRG